MSGDEERRAVDARLPPQRAQALREEADDAVVRRAHARPGLQRHLLLHQAHREPGRPVGGPARRDQEHLRAPGHPRGRAQVPGRRHRPVRIRGRLSPQPRGPRAPGRAVLRHGHRGARVPRPRAQVLRHDHPAQRQQVRRAQLGGVERGVVHLRAAGGQRRPAPAGLLPDQHREHGPVRAHPDHRRRGQPGPLRGGLLGAGLLDRLAALGGRRARRAARRAHHLHDDPELVEQRLQPRDQARARRGRGPRRVDRRQHRLAPDDEVPVGLPHGSQGLGRGPLGRLRRTRARSKTPAPR